MKAQQLEQTMRYATTLTNGHTMETNSAHEAQSFTHYSTGQTFALFGKPVTAEEFFLRVREAVQSAWDKKCETHRRVSVQHGATHLSRVEKWVRK